MATESFTGTGALSASWTHQQNTCSRSSDQGKGDTVGDYNFSFWNADVFGANQYSQAVAAVVLNDAANYSAVSVRASGTGGSSNWYAIFWDGTDNDLVKNVAGTITTIAHNIIASVVASDVIRLSVDGTTLRVTKNGVQQGSDVIDASLATGSAGIGSYSSGARIDDWEGGDLAVPGERPPMILTFLQ